MARENRTLPGDSSGSNPSYFTLADQVFELSSKLGELRQRTIRNVEALRRAAEGVPELEKAFRPLRDVLKGGLVACHEADVAAVFGRRVPNSRGLESPLAGGHVRGPATVGVNRGGGTGWNRGRTAVAAKHLASTISALDVDVNAAAVLVEQEDTFRAIARWAVRQYSTSTAAARPLPASALALSRPGYAGRGCIGRGGERPARSEQEPDQYNPCDDWALKVFPREVGGESGAERGDAGAAGKSSHGSGRELSRPALLVVVNALRAPLAPVAPGKSFSSLPSTAGGRGESRIPESVLSSPCSSDLGEGRGAWRNTLSWLTGGVRSTPRVAESHPPPKPARPWVTTPPRVILRVVYAADASDMLERIVMAMAEGPDDEPLQETMAILNEPIPASDEGADGDTGGTSRMNGKGEARSARKVSAFGSAPVGSSARRDGSISVQLLKSEVRVRHGDFGGHPVAGRKEGKANSGREPSSQGTCARGTQLQVVLRLRTPTPVVVSRLLHHGGHFLAHTTAPLHRNAYEQGPSLESLREDRDVSTRLTEPSAGASRSSSEVPEYRSDKSEGGDAHVQSERHDGERVADGGVFRGGGRVHAGGGDYWSPVGYDYSDSRRRDPVDEGGDGGGEDRDVVQSGWGQAPVELRLPEGFSNGGCELKVGTDHLLGMNITLPGTQPPSIVTRMTGSRPRASNTLEANSQVPSGPLRWSSRPQSTASMALSSQAQRVTDHGVVVDGDEGDKPSWSEPERQVLDQSFQLQQQQQRTVAPEAERWDWCAGVKRPRPESSDHAVDTKRMTLGENQGFNGSRQSGAGRSYSSQGTTTRTSHAQCNGVGYGGDTARVNSHTEGDQGTRRASKRRKKATWGWGFLRLWRRAEADEYNEDRGIGDGKNSRKAVVAARAEDVNSTPEPSDNQEKHQLQKLPHHTKAAAAAAAADDDELCKDEFMGHSSGENHKTGAFDAPQGRECTNAHDGGASAASPSSPHRRGGSSHVTGYGISKTLLRRSPLLITVVLAPPPPRHGDHHLSQHP